MSGKKVFAAFALAALLVSPAFAEDQIPQAKLTLAKELIQVSGAEAIIGSADSMMDSMVEQVKRSAPGIDDQAIDTLKAIARDEYVKGAPRLLEESANLYARHFSEGEMHDMIAFYKTDTGKRVVVEMPALMRESIGLSTEISGNIVKRFVAYLQERASKEKATP